MPKKKTTTPQDIKRSTIAIQGARVHNLKDISLEVPRDQLVAVTGLSGSGKSSLAFDTIYAEGQRRYMESLSSYAKRFIAQVTKPDVDFMFGLSPVISIEQKTIGHNPRSTVGTMTEISSYLNLLFATIGAPQCPYCRGDIPVKSTNQILDQILSLPAGTVVELRAPIFKIYQEVYDFLFTEIRKKGYRNLYVDGKRTDISDQIDLDESRDYSIQVVVDKFVLQPGIDKQLLTGIQNALLIGDPYLEVSIVKAASKKAAKEFYPHFGCAKHHLIVGDLTPEFFMFNNPPSACRTCLGLGTAKHVHPDLLVPDKGRSIRAGCFVQEACTYKPDNWTGRHLYSLSQHYGFSLDTPFEELPAAVVDLLLYGTKGEKYTLQLPPTAKAHTDPSAAGAWMRMVGNPIAFDGIARGIERNYRHYRQKQVANSNMEAWLEKVMVEYRCPDCNGTRLKPARLLFAVGGKNIHDFGQLNFDELRPFLDTIKPQGRQQTAGRQILNELKGRLDLLLGIGLDYLNLNRRSSTLSGGESQRIRLSTQIGSGLMGMLYVLDEPSIGLHPKDNVKMVDTLHRLRDLGNTVIVVEHDEQTIRAADHIVEMGPGPGIHGGKVVAQGTLADIMACKNSPTGRYLAGIETIPLPAERRPLNGKKLTIRGARENNLKNIEVEFPLGQLICITGASGSGKSTLINEILYKKLWNRLVDSRTLSGRAIALKVRR